MLDQAPGLRRPLLPSKLSTLSLQVAEVAVQVGRHRGHPREEPVVVLVVTVRPYLANPLVEARLPNPH